MRSFADPLGYGYALAIHRAHRRSRVTGRRRAYFRVHSFARQLASTFPPLAAVGSKTSRIKIGPAVIIVAFGSTVTFGRGDGRVQKYPTVGDDEADPRAARLPSDPQWQGLVEEAVGDGSAQPEA
jgi:hypothetical protein